MDETKRGSTDAYAELVHRYQDVAFRTAYVVLADAPESEDVVQEAFVKAYYALGRFRAGAAFRPWILTIVANEARNRRVSTWRRARLALLAASSTDSGGSEPSPEALVLAREQREQLMDALGGLSADDRDVIVYRYFSGLSEAEMAEAFDCARGTVKSRLSRALGRLRVALEEGRTAQVRVEELPA